MPDDDDAFETPGTDDLLMFHTVMGWDGDRCQCPDCACERFRDGSDDTLCRECLAGDHSTAHG